MATQIIKNENSKAQYYSAIFLIALGLFVFVTGYYGQSMAGAFLGASFSILSTLCLALIRLRLASYARLLWGILTPILIFISPLLFTIEKTSVVFSFGYAYAGGVLFCIYSFERGVESLYMWASISLFSLGILFYDQIILANHIPGLNFEFITSNYGHFKLMQCLFFLSLVFLTLMVRRNKHRIEDKLSLQIHRMRVFAEKLLYFSKQKPVYSGDLQASMKEIARFVSGSIRCSRVSIWEYDYTLNAIRPLVCYDALNKKHLEESILYKKDFPNYFKALLSEKMIVADQAQSDEKTKEFLHSYLQPNGILSLMDTPFFMDGVFRGILCCEEQREAKKWDAVDLLFAQSMTKYISIAYYYVLRRQQHEALEKAEKELKSQNELLQNVNKSITELNEDLSSHLNWKDKSLQEIKNFLNDLSYKNSHQVRGPISRILGLVNVYKNETDPLKKELYIEYIQKSGEELDAIIKEVSMAIYKRT